MVKLSLPHQRFVFTGIGIVLVALSLLMPVWDVAEPAHFIGSLLVWAAMLEIVHGFRRAENNARTSAWISGAITLLIGILLLNAALFQRKPLIDFILFLFGIDACRYLYLFLRNRRQGKPSLTDLLSGIGNAMVVILVLIVRGKGLEWVISLSGSLRILGTVYSLYTARTGTLKMVAEDVVGSLGLKGDKDFEQLAVGVQEQYEQRAPLTEGGSFHLSLSCFSFISAGWGWTVLRWGFCHPLWP